jgi:hypothetical protein
MRKLVTIGLAVLCSSTSAQLLVLNGASMEVNGTSVVINGGLTGGATSSIANQGTITLTGDLLNNSSGPLFMPVAGEVVMRGGAQAVGGSSDTHFDELALECTSLTLNRDAQVGGAYAFPSGQLKLGDAPFYLNSHRLTITNPAVTAITRIAGRIISETDPLPGYGEVEWRLGTATGSRLIPFGTTTEFLPLTIDIATAGTGAGAIRAATYPTDPFASPNNRPLPSGLPSLVDIGGFENAPQVVDRFWPIATSGYTAQPTVAYTFTYRDSEWSTGTNMITEASLQAQRFNGAQWSASVGVVNTITNSVTTSVVNEHGIVWALASALSPLPVELLHFDATPGEAQVNCAWSTASEQGSMAFVVQRSSDGEHFEDIGTIAAAGNSSSMREYVFIDERPLMGLSYYRLQQIDLDGTTALSQAVPVYFANGIRDAELRVFPNPCTEELFIAEIGAELSAAVIRDALGRIAMRITLQGPALCRIEASSLKPGHYTIVVQDQCRQRTAHFIKQ